jgi:hypothetical protein
MDIAKLTTYCLINLDFTNLQLDQAYFYLSLPLCVIDAVYSIGVRYSATEATVRRASLSLWDRGAFPRGRGPRVRGY